MMKYKLLSNGSGVIMTRQPRLIHEDLAVRFDDIPEGATALFIVGSKSFYRKPENGCCTLPCAALSGTVRVSVSTIEDPSAGRWSCESLKADRQPDGSVLVAPDDMDLPNVVARHRIEADELKLLVLSLQDALRALEERLDGMIEGYDLT